MAKALVKELRGYHVYDDAVLLDLLESAAAEIELLTIENSDLLDEISSLEDNLYDLRVELEDR